MYDETPSSDETTCFDESCYFYCTNSDCRETTIHCQPQNPLDRTNDCKQCVVICRGRCAELIVYSYECQSVIIGVVEGNGNRKTKNATIYGPNNGNLYVFARDHDEDQYDDSGDLYIEDSTFFTNDTNYTSVEFYRVPCDNNVFYGETSNEFHYLCSNEAICTDNRIYCPDNGKNDVIDGSSCFVEYGVNGYANGNKFYAIEGLLRVKFRFLCPVFSWLPTGC